LKLFQGVAYVRLFASACVFAFQSFSYGSDAALEAQLCFQPGGVIQGQGGPSSSKFNSDLFLLTQRELIHGKTPHSGNETTLGLFSKSLLLKYYDIYSKFPKEFFPFSKGNRSDFFENESVAEKLYHHICKDPSTEHSLPECKIHRQKLISFFDYQQKHHVYPIELNLNSIQELLSAVEKIRISLRTAQDAIESELKSALFSNDGLKPEIDSVTIYNETIAHVLRQPKLLELIRTYEDTYLDASVSLNQLGIPQEILLSDVIQGKVTGNFYDVEYTDIVQSVETQTKTIRKLFQKTIQKYPNSISQMDFASGNYSASNIDYSDLRHKCKGILKTWLESRPFYSYMANDESFPQIKSFHSNDIKVIPFLAQKEYQMALWYLKENKLPQADALENWLDRQVIVVENKGKVAPLGGGSSTTQLIHFTDQLKLDQVKTVYKPPHQLMEKFVALKLTGQDLVDAIITHQSHEVAAYRVDRLIGLNRVPLTKSIDIEGGNGSVQVFVDYGTNARQMTPIDSNYPEQVEKFGKARGRTVLSKNIRFFDWLIGNYDRNLDNYLYRDDGREVLIDHGFSFEAPRVVRLYLQFFLHPLSGQPFPIEPSKVELNSEEMEVIKPSKEIRQKVIYLYQNPSVVDSALKGLLKDSSLKIFKQKIAYASEYYSEK